MAEITAAMVKELRERTGAGMLACKNALTETNGDMEEAIVALRKIMGGKLDVVGARTADEGIIAVHVVDNQDAAIIELNSETDFVARSDDFKGLARELAQQVASEKGHSVETVLDQKSIANADMTVKDRLHDVYAKLRENIVFKRFEFISTDANGAVFAYVHVPANDKIGVLVEIEAASAEEAKSEAAQSAGRELAMQVAAARPRYLKREDVPATVLDKEREIAAEQAKNEGRPEAALEKIVEGRVRKFYEAAVLLDQPYMREPKKTVTQFLAEAAKGVTVKRFVRFEVGERVTGVEASGSVKETAE